MPAAALVAVVACGLATLTQVRATRAASPGLILFGILGIGPLVAARLVWLQHWLAPPATCVVGVALLIWLAVEIAIVG